MINAIQMEKKNNPAVKEQSVVACHFDDPNNNYKATLVIELLN